MTTLVVAKTTPPPPPPDNGSLSGKVGDDNGPLKGAVVNLNGTTVIADINGNYSFSSITPCTYAITCSATGYQYQTLNVTINAGINIKDITMVPVSAGTGTVTFTLAGYTQYTGVDVWIDDDEMSDNGFVGQAITYTLPVGTHTWHSRNSNVSPNRYKSGTFTIIAGQNIPITLTIP